MDSGGNVYFIAFEPEWLVIKKVSPDGVPSGRWRAKRYLGYEYLMFGDLVFDRDGGAYCAVYQVDSRDYTVSVQRWLKIDFSAEQDTLVYERYYERMPEPAAIRLLCENGELCSITAYPDKLVTDIFSIDGEITVNSYETDANFANGVNLAYPCPDGTILLSNIYSELYSVLPGSSFIKLYGENAGAFSGFQMDGSGGIWICRYEPGIWERIEHVSTGAATVQTEISVPDGAWTGYILDESQCVTLNEDGLSAKTHMNGITANLKYPGNQKLLWPYSLAAAALFGVYIILSGLMRRRTVTISLLVKQALIILAVIGAGAALMSEFMTARFEKSHADTMIYAIRKTVHKYKNLLDIERLSAMDADSISESSYFSTLREQFAYTLDETELRVLSENGQYDYTNIRENHYVNLFLIKDGEIRTGVCADYYANIPLKYIIGQELFDEYETLINGASYDGLVTGLGDVTGDWIAMTMPVFDADGNPVALIESGISKRQYVFETEQTLRYILVCLTAVMGSAMLLMLIGLSFSLKSLKKLRRAVEDVGHGDYRVSVRVKSRDEVAGISDAFNKMAIQIDNHTAKLETLNKAYFRFLPAEVIKMLGKESVVDVRQGSYTRLHTHILHISIVNFEEITGTMGVDDIFAFHNTICGKVMDAVVSGGGLVESYNQSEFICLFDAADSCLEAAMGVLTWRNSLNETRTQKLEMSLVIVRGDALLGVVGYEKRLGTLMLSRIIKLSHHLTKLGKLYGISLLCPENIVLDERQPRRYIGRFDSGDNIICLFDYFGCDEYDTFLSKKRLAPLFERGVSLFEQGNWEESKQIFIQCLRDSVPDSAVKQYVFLCEHNINNPLWKKGFGQI